MTENKKPQNNEIEQFLNTKTKINNLRERFIKIPRTKSEIESVDLQRGICPTALAECGADNPCSALT